MFAKDTFKNKHILVTGGRSGIGFQIAKDFLELGANVIIASRKEKPLAEAAEKLANFGTVLHKACDIRKTEDIKQLANFIKEKYGCLDVLVNNAEVNFLH
ncbi:MAG: hypothetical protein CM15mP65_24720 [Crocinitomicaceae bacterium]|nr:MAG: hypothetical protein CM15mP65_24720 [Crocinitomicaceae bacterium]